MDSEPIFESGFLGREWWKWFWQELKQTATPHLTHSEGLSSREVERQSSYESLDYYKSYSTIYIQHLRQHHRRRLEFQQTRLESRTRADELSSLNNNSFIPNGEEITAHLNQLAVVHDEEERNTAIRWLLHVLIALSVGVVVTIVSYGVEILEHFREKTLLTIIQVAPLRIVGYLGGLLFWVSIAAALSAVAAAVVVFFEPAASGGGIPDIMAYLNGVHLRRALSLKTFIAKAISCIFAVASGMPVGLEAPLIHLGGITGAGVTQGRSRTLGFQTGWFQAFRNNKDRRDFITAGAACGVSAAFGAPIGGLLFVMEEVSSFWEVASSGQIFLATMVGFTVTTMINSVVEDKRLLGWVSNAASVLFEVNLTIPLHLVSIIPSLVLGALLGALAAFFTKVNLILTKWRREKLKPFPMRRFIEPILLAAVFTAITYSVTLFSDCRSIKTLGEVNETILVWGTEDPSRLFNGTCSSSDTYSPFGSLGLATGKNVIRHLFTRQTIGEFPIYYLTLYFVLYFMFACFCSGTAVSGGLVVPSLVIGAIFGRMYGLCLWYAGVSNVGEERGYWRTDAWMDPGVFALIGAGAFLAGTSRMTMSICVIMVELSSELHYLLPVMVAIVMSKTVADWLSEPLYHHMLHMDCVPYLGAQLTHPELEQLTAADVMSSPLISFCCRERTEVILSAMRETTHNAFPVFDGANHQHEMKPSKFIGLVTREDLQVYLTLPQLRQSATSNREEDSTAPNLVHSLTWNDWIKHKASLFLLAEDRYSWIQTHIPGTGTNAESDSTPSLPPVVDLSLIVNRSPWCVPLFFNLKMAYHTFRMMGLRHLVVVDGEEAKGIITRKDLLPKVLLQRLQELQERTSEETTEPQSVMPQPSTAPPEGEVLNESSVQIPIENTPSSPNVNSVMDDLFK